VESLRSIAGGLLKDAKPSGDDHYLSKCPFHHTKSGRPFSLNVRNGLWICYSCGVTGTLPKLLLRLGFSRERITSVLANVELGQAPDAKERLRTELRKGWTILPEYVLGAWDEIPQDLLDLGFTREILVAHDVGLDRMEDRITFPIRDYLGRLVAVSGRARSRNAAIRYKVYDAVFDVFAERKYDPKSKLHVYGLHTVYPERFWKPGVEHPPLIVVEGFKGCLWMRQLSFTHTVGLMGSMLSRSQAVMLGRVKGPYYVMMDNEPGKAWPDDRGNCAAVKIARALSVYGPARICAYEEGAPEGTSPDDLKTDQVERMLQAAVPPGQAYVNTSNQWRRAR
jgi:DNA primase